MKIVERISRWIVVWLSLSLLLKCSALAFDTASVLNKVSKEETYYERKAYQIS